jgi:hypothetical protein
MKLPVHAVTTRHSQSVYPLQVSSGLPSSGCLIGRNALTGAPFVFDPWLLYQQGFITDYCMLVIGRKGLGKSALTKSYIARQVAVFGHEAYILDPKGEYADLARHLPGMWHLKLVPGGSTCLNPLDPPAGSPTRTDVRQSRIKILEALASSGLKRDVNAREANAVAAAITAAEADSDVLLLPSIVELLRHPTAKMAYGLATTPRALADEVRDAASELFRLCDGTLAGMFDGPSTVELREGVGGVIDLSAVQRSSEALPPIMVCALGWLARVIPSPSAMPRLLVIDEAWSVMGPSTVEWLQMVSKLSRNWKLSLMLILHRLTDLRALGDDSSATGKKAIGLISDIETVVSFGSHDTEAEDVAKTLGLTRVEEGLLPTMDQGRCIWRIGSHHALVDVVLTDVERGITDTDTPEAPPPAAIDLGAGTVPAPEQLKGQ